MGGPYSAAAADAEWDVVTGMWARLGFGLLVLTPVNGDRAIGLAGVFMPEGHPEPELAWNLWDQADEGRGLATEAATAVRDWAFDTCGCASLVSYIHPENHRSAAVAERVGAKLDAKAPCPYPPPVLIYRHRQGQI